MKKQNTILLLFIIFCYAAPHVAYTQCATPATDVCARATGAADVNFGTDDFAGDEVFTDTVCIYTQADGDGVAQARNSGVSDQFTTDNQYYAVVDGSGNEIQMQVEVRGTIDLTWRTIRADQGFLDKLWDVGENPAENELCGIGGNTNDVRTTLQRTWIDGAIPGVYTGTISLEVRPD
jgi:hypothetical protein